MSQSPPPVLPAGLPAAALSAAHSAPLTAAALSAAHSAPASSIFDGFVSAAGSPAPLHSFFGLIRDIRAEAQNLQSALQEVQMKTEIVDTKVREREMRTVLQANGGIFEHNRGQIDQRLLELRVLLQANPKLYSYNGDDATFIENFWERASNTWPKPDQPLDELVANTSKSDSYLSKLIYRCGLVTIPERANEHLRQLRVGRSLDFHGTFDDELPILEDRIAVLNFLYAHPLAIEGVVNVEQGVIVRASQSVYRRGLSYVIPFLLPIVGALLLEYIYPLVVPDVTQQTLSMLHKGYWALIAGGYLHVIVGSLKEARASKGTSLLAIEDWVMWLHVKEAQIFVGIISLWVGFIGMLVMYKSASMVTAFFIGYSIDSFTDLFLERFSTTVTTRTEAIKKELPK